MTEAFHAAMALPAASHAQRAMRPARFCVHHAAGRGGRCGGAAGVLVLLCILIAVLQFKRAHFGGTQSGAGERFLIVNGPSSTQAVCVIYPSVCKVSCPAALVVP